MNTKTAVPWTDHKLSTWKALARWNEQARKAGRVEKVLVGPPADLFRTDADVWRSKAWQVMRGCTNLDFQVLTGRPLRIADHLPPDWGAGYANVWLGVSIETDGDAWRADVIRQIPAQVRWISAEPLLGPLSHLDLTGFHWIVVAGESGRGYRSMPHAWARKIRDLAKARGVAFFFKQSAGPQAGMGDLLDGRRWNEFPTIPVPCTEIPGPRNEKETASSAVGGGPPPVDEEAERARQEADRLREQLRNWEQEAETLRATLEGVRRAARLQQELLTAQFTAARGTATLFEARAAYHEARSDRLQDELDALRAEKARPTRPRPPRSSWHRPRPAAPPRAPSVPPEVHADLATLGLRWPCTAVEVTQAHRAQVKQHHPDRGGSAEAFNTVQSAYERVRRAFDRLGIQ
jgi:protein gp37